MHTMFIHPHLQSSLDFVACGFRLAVAPLRQRHLGVRREGVRKVVDITLHPRKTYVLPWRTRHNMK